MNNPKLCKCGKYPIRMICIQPQCAQKKAVCYQCISNFHIDHEEKMMPIYNFEKLITEENQQTQTICDNEFEQSININDYILECYQLIKSEFVKFIEKCHEGILKRSQ